MKKRKWLSMSKKTDPELPLKPPIPFLENYSNGEFFYEQTPRDRLITKLILERADEKSRKLGIDRRQFLASTMGMVTSLGVINTVSGCSSDGGFNAPDAGTMDCDQSRELVSGGDYFIFDMQTHHVDPSGEYIERNPLIARGLPGIFPGGDCDEGMNTNDCLDYDNYIDLIFLESDTTMAILSGFPASHCETGAEVCGLIIENDVMAREREEINRAADSQRMINHCNVAPNDGLEFQLDHMQYIQENFGVVGGWKLYTGWVPPSGGDGWFMDDPAVGIPMIEKGIELGMPTFCVHKGPPLVQFNPKFNDSRDMGVVAKMFPEANFVIYHSGLGFEEFGEGGTREPYDPNVNAGVNNVIKTLEDNQLGHGSNLYAELGSLWASVMTDSVGAQHVIGKLLKYFGEDNVLWGSECIWFASPQPQIEAFKTFTISQEFQEQYGYPELTDEIRAKIFGLNAARLYGIDPEEKRCQIDPMMLATAKRHLDGELGDRRWAFQKPLGPTTRREFIQLVRKNRFEGRPG